MAQQALFGDQEVREANARRYRVQVVRVEMVREKTLATECGVITSPLEVFRLVEPLIGHADREHFLVVCLNTKNKAVAVHTAGIGTLNSSLVHPREVFKAAILSNAAAVVLAHNHPSGDPEPSRDDIAITQRLVECGRILGIQVLDHVVVGEEYCFSFKERNLI